MTVTSLHDHLMAEVRRLNVEYRRRSLRCNYTKKYVWYDRIVMRPFLMDRELVLQDYGIEPGFGVKINPHLGYEKMWGQPNPMEPKNERPLDKMDPCEDKDLLVRLDKGPPTAKTRLFCFLWMGGTADEYKPLADKLPKDVACYVLQMPGRSNRAHDECYPTGAFAVEVLAQTLAPEMKKPGSNYFFAHGQGSHFAYYATKLLKTKYATGPKALFVSSFCVPSAISQPSVATLRDRQNACANLRILIGMIKSGWGTDPDLGYKSHTGYCNYQSHQPWENARPCITDYWTIKDFPLPKADEPLDCPIVAFHGKDDEAVSLDLVKAWKNLTKNSGAFEVKAIEGPHLWFSSSSRRSEELADQLSVLLKKFP